MNNGIKVHNRDFVINGDDIGIVKRDLYGLLNDIDNKLYKLDDKSLEYIKVEIKQLSDKYCR